MQGLREGPLSGRASQVEGASQRQGPDSLWRTPTWQACLSRVLQVARGQCSGPSVGCSCFWAESQPG